MSTPYITFTSTVDCGGYHYEINTVEYRIDYKENDYPSANSSVTFGSREEMKAVAEAMLKLLEITE